MKVLRLFSSWSSDFKIRSICTAWKVSKYGVISGPYFPAFRLNMEIYSVFSPNTGKCGPESNSYLDTFQAVMVKYMVKGQIYGKRKIITSFVFHTKIFKILVI